MGTFFMGKKMYLLPFHYRKSCMGPWFFGRCWKLIRSRWCGPWATAKQQVQEEHMPDSHQQKELPGGHSGTACKGHAPLFFWHWGILITLHQAKQMIFKFNFQLCNNSYHKYLGNIVQENFSYETTWVFKNHHILLLKLNAHKKLLRKLETLAAP